eukprot:scaffold1562_cov170-Amphora_coffeaeformis.AAC.15
MAMQVKGGTKFATAARSLFWSGIFGRVPAVLEVVGCCHGDDVYVCDRAVCMQGASMEGQECVQRNHIEDAMMMKILLHIQIPRRPAILITVSAGKLNSKDIYSYILYMYVRDVSLSFTNSSLAQRILNNAQKRKL